MLPLFFRMYVDGVVKEMNANDVKGSGKDDGRFECS